MGASTIVLHDAGTVVLQKTDSRIVVASGAQGPAGRSGAIGRTAGNALTVTAGISLGGHRMIVINTSGLAILADASIPEHAYKVLGLTLGAAASGSSVDVLRSGELDEPSWHWTLDAPVFLGQNGLLTQDLPAPPSLFSLIVGFPVTTTKLFVALREPIYLI